MNEVKIIEGWIARDLGGDAYVGTNKPEESAGIWTNFGDCMELKEDEFQDLTFEESPKEIVLTIQSKNLPTLLQLARKVRIMRSAQKVYFGCKRQAALIKAKELEKSVDEIVELIINQE